MSVIVYRERSRTTRQQEHDKTIQAERPHMTTSSGPGTTTHMQQYMQPRRASREEWLLIIPLLL